MSMLAPVPVPPEARPYRRCVPTAAAVLCAPPSVAEASSTAARKCTRATLAAAALVLTVQLVYFTGIVASDDFGYLHCAVRGPAADQEGFRQFLVRMTHWLPLAVVIRTWPGHPEVVSLPALLAMGATLWSVARIARRDLNLSRPWLAVLFFGLVPVNVIMATVPLPDTTATALAWLGLALCIPCLLSRDRTGPAGSCLAGGALIAAGYNAKETAAILIPSLVLFVALYRTKTAWAWRRAGLVVAGGAAWLAAEALLLWHWTGDPLAHAHAIKEAEASYGVPAVERSLRGLADFGGDYVGWLLDPRGDYGPVGPILLASLVYLLVRRRDAVAGFLACLAVPGLIYLSVGSSSLTAYQPIHHQTRYLLPFLPALALAAALMTDRAWSRFRVCRRPLAAALAIVILASIVAPNRLAGRWYYASIFSAGRAVLAEHVAARGDAPIYASILSANRFQVSPEWLGGACVARIEPPPQTVEEWTARYGGAYVLITALDRQPPTKSSHVGRTLGEAAGRAMLEWERVARVEPAGDRLGMLWARLTHQPISTEAKYAVEMYRVPAIHDRRRTDKDCTPVAEARRGTAG